MDLYGLPLAIAALAAAVIVAMWLGWDDPGA